MSAERRSTIENICSHWWVNKGSDSSCLRVAEQLASQTPVRLDLLLSLAPQGRDREHMLTPGDEEVRTGQGRTGQDRTGQARTGQGRPGQDRAGQDRAGQGRAAQGRT